MLINFNYCSYLSINFIYKINIYAIHVDHLRHRLNNFWEYSIEIRQGHNKMIFVNETSNITTSEKHFDYAPLTQSLSKVAFYCFTACINVFFGLLVATHIKN